MAGITIGENSVMGEGNVVIKDIPSKGVALGNPYKFYCEIIRDDIEVDNQYY